MTPLREAAQQSLDLVCGDWCGPGRGSAECGDCPLEGMRAALSAPDPMLVDWRAIEDVTRDCCSCGGGGPNDKHTCPACMVWHRLRAYENEGGE